MDCVWFNKYLIPVEAESGSLLVYLADLTKLLIVKNPSVIHSSYCERQQLCHKPLAFLPMVERFGQRNSQYTSFCTHIQFLGTNTQHLIDTWDNIFEANE